MATIEKLLPLILKWEGGYVNDPDDRGGPTGKGITLATWNAHGYDKNGDGVIDEEDVKMINPEDVRFILKEHYWDRWKADQIQNQSIANLLVGWVWGSGKYGITIPQGVVGVKQDGIVGPKTLNALNQYPDQEELFYKLWHAKRAYLNMICLDRPQNKKFLKGWLNRLKDYRWLPVVLLALLLGFSSCRTGTIAEKRETAGHIVEETDSLVRENVKRTSFQESVFSQLSILQKTSELRIEKRTYDVSGEIDSLTGKYPLREEVFIRQSEIQHGVVLENDTFQVVTNEDKYRESHADSRLKISEWEKSDVKRETGAGKMVRRVIYGVVMVVIAVFVVWKKRVSV